MNELELARAIAVGEVPSPQQCGNIWLFALRITGTGLAFREKHGEYVYRNPDNYLTDDFIGRCAALPVIWEHPDTEDSTLDSDEYGNRAIGAIMLPYQNGNEIWGIARIQNESAAAHMAQGSLSTSPCLTLEPKGTIEHEQLDHPLLMEGKPVFLDHLAVCQSGVWDKGGEPSGINTTTRADSVEPEELTKTEPAEAQPTLGDVLRAIMALTKVFEQHEKTEVKAEPEKPENIVGDPENGEKPVKADAEVDAPENVVADAIEAGAKPAEAAPAEAAKPGCVSKADAALQARNNELEARLKKLEQSVMPKILSDEQRNELSTAQARADSVASAFGTSAPPPLAGEGPTAYRRRLAKAFQKHSSAWRGIDLNTLTDAGALAIAEAQIYADAATASVSPSIIGAGRLVARKTTDDAGHRRIEYHGDPNACWGMFTQQPKRVTGFNKGAK